jgi:hypothetical protein
MAGLAGIWLGAAWMLASPGWAASNPGCPPFDAENTPWGVVMRWHAQGVTPAQQEAFLRQGVVPRYPITLWPPSGPAPLQVGVLVHLPLGTSLVTIEIDADGDGVPEVVDTREENLGYVYAKPGTYPAKIRVREADGRVTAYAAPVEVLTQEAFDGELHGRWRAFTEALEARDLTAALDCVHSEVRQRHTPVLRGLLGSRSRSFPTLVFRDFRVAEARYRGVSSTPGSTKAVDVRFRPDADGVWRLTSFFEEIGVEP